MRKHLLQSQASAPDAREIPVTAVATVFVTSEDADHPVDYAFNRSRGPGGTRWIAEQAGEQAIILVFDTPQTIRQVSLEVEEKEVRRTQELALSVSSDGGQHYRELRRQEFTFSPDGGTFEREEWTICEPSVTHMRVAIKPDKGGKSCRAALTSLALMS
jgi:hypothetical protein